MYIYILYTLQILVHIYLLFLLSKELKNNKSFWWLFIFNISIVIWILFSTFILLQYNKEYVIWFVKGTYSITSISLFSFVLFLRYNLTKKYDIVSKLALFTSSFLSILSFTDLIIKAVVITDYSQYVPVVFGDLSFLYIANFIFCIIALIIPILKKRNEIQGLESLRLRYVTTSMIVGGIFAMLTNIIIPSLTGTSGSAIWGPMAMGIISSITTYSYVKNRLFSIKYLLKNSLFYIILFLIAFLYLVITTSILNSLAIKIFSTDGITILISSSILFIITFLLIQKFSKQKLVTSITSTKINPDYLRDSFIKTISTKLDIRELGITTLSTIIKTFQLKNSGILIFKKDNASVLFSIFKGINSKNLDVRDLLQVIYYWDKLKHSTILVKDEIKQIKTDDKRLKRILFFMEQNHIEVILPLNRKVQLNGVVILGQKNDLSPYTTEEISFLESIVINASIAFGRAILHQEVEELNRSLQNKVDLQTKELKEKLKLLEEARRKENDMIDIMGHELRTPATIIRLNVDFLTKFQDKVPSDRESFVKYMQRIKDAVETQIKLINTLLTSAKLVGDKIQLELEKVDIKKEIEMAIHAEEQTAQQKNLYIKNNITNNKLLAYADQVRVSEILFNLINNAVKYTEKGGVTIDATIEKEYIKISIQDTGKGIPKSDIPKLGTKFFRTKTYIESENGDNFNIVRPGGTGLGLYVTFELAKKMKGRIEVKTQEGKGSTFTVYLPKYDIKKINPSKNTDTKDMFKKLGLRN